MKVPTWNRSQIEFGRRECAFSKKWENILKLFPRFYEKIIPKNIIFSFFWSEKLIFFYFLMKIEKIISKYFLAEIMLEHLWIQFDALHLWNVSEKFKKFPSSFIFLVFGFWIPINQLIVFVQRIKIRLREITYLGQNHNLWFLFYHPMGNWQWLMVHNSW